MMSDERTLFCGNLSERVTEDLLYELFLQAGPVEKVSIPKDKDGRQRNFGFVTFKHAVSVPYSIALMDGTTLFGRLLRLDPRESKKSEPNPYLDQLMQYKSSSKRSNDNRARRRDSRWSDSSDKVQTPPNTPIAYPAYFPQYGMPYMNIPTMPYNYANPFNMLR